MTALSKDEMVKPDDFKFKHADLLNRLHEMQRSPYYATACHTLIRAEMAIVGLEQDIAPLVAKVERLNVRWDRSVTVNMSLQAEVDKTNRALDVALTKGREAFEERDALKTELASMKAGEPVAWRVHPFDYGIGSEGVHALTMRQDQVMVWRNKGWNVQPLYTTPQPSAVKVVRELVEALEAVEALIEHQYTGTRDGMNALQNAANDAHGALKIGQQFLKESGE